MKLKKKHYYMISAVGILALLLLLTFILTTPPPGIESLNPEDYKDNPKLCNLVKNTRNKNYLSFRAASYNLEDFAEDPRFFDICIKVLEDEPSYYEFITQELSWKDFKAPLEVIDKWEKYCTLKSVCHGMFVRGLTFDKRLYPILIKYLNSKWPAYRYWTVKALEGDKRAIEPLISALNDKDSDVRSAAIRALGDLGDKRTVEPLILALQDKKSDVRIHVIIALGDLGDKRAVEPLIIMLKDEEFDVREYAAWVLGKFGDKRAIPPMEERLKIEKNKDVIDRISNALAELKPSSEDATKQH